MSGQRVLIYGGKGALGATIVRYFKQKDWWVGNIDMTANEDADHNILVSITDSWTDQHEDVMNKVREGLGGEKVDTILCVAGGWAGGNASSKDFIKNSDLMWKQSVWTSAIAGSLSAQHLKEGGLLQLTGAVPSLSGTPGMMGYGMAKAAVHQLVKSFAAEGSGLPVGSSVVAILPVTLDTPMNRKFMSSADFTTWTTLEFVAEMLHKWSMNEDRPSSGSLVKLITKNSITEQVLAD